LKTCVDPYLESFAKSFAVPNYTSGTIATYRSIIRKLGQVMDAERIKPSSLTIGEAERLGRKVPRKHGRTVCPHNLARRFAEHLIDIGVVRPLPPTVAQMERITLLAEFETYLVKQRGLSQRTIYHTLRFAERFLDHHFGKARLDLRRADCFYVFGAVRLQWK